MGESFKIKNTNLWEKKPPEVPQRNGKKPLLKILKGSLKKNGPLKRKKILGKPGNPKSPTKR